MAHLFFQWLNFVFSHPDWMGALVIAGKTAVIFIFLVVGLRLMGKRSLGQMSIYDLVLIIVLANSVQNAMVGHDTTLVGGIVAALVLLILNRIASWLVIHEPKVREILVGHPVLIVRDGQMLKDVMGREGVTKEHVMAAMREHGIGHLDQVQMAVLEVDGSISIVPKSSATYRTQRHFKGLRVI